MWLKLLIQLRDILPHLSNLIPLMERFLAQRHEMAKTAAFDPAAFDDLKGDLGAVAKSHAAIHHQLHENAESLTALSLELKTLRTIADTSQNRIATQEDQIGSLGLWLKLTTTLTFFLTIAILVLLLRH